MAIDLESKTIVGPPKPGGGRFPSFNSTTKVVAFATAHIPLYPQSIISYPDEHLDTLDEFDGTYFRPKTTGWYGVGGLARCRGLDLNTWNGRYFLRIVKNGSVHVTATWDAAPTGGTTSCEFYNFVYLTITDELWTVATQSPDAPLAYYRGADPYPTNLFIHRIL